MVEEIRLALLGFGSANRALVQMLLNKSESHCNRKCLRIHNGTNSSKLIPWRIVSIVTGRHGRICIPIVEDLDELLYEVDAKEALRRSNSGEMMLDGSLIIETSRAPSSKCTRINADADILSVTKEAPEVEHQVSARDVDTSSTQQTIELLRILAKTNTANIVVEAIPSNPRHGGGEPAVSFIRTSLESGMHVVSANKGPLAQQLSDSDGTDEVYWKLQQIAAENNVRYLHESAVMDGVPIFSLWQNTLPNATLTKLRGCLNSTSTMIITRMEGHDGDTFEQALGKAKDVGIVEADESLDIDGYDAAVKLRALMVAFSIQTAESKILVPPIDDIPRDSIRNITNNDLQRAFEDGGKKFRLVASAGEHKAAALLNTFHQI